jgi:hypothetical protein
MKKIYSSSKNIIGKNSGLPTSFYAILLFLVAFSNLAWGQFDTTRVFPASGSWICPAGVSTVLVECIGAGGAGGSGRNNNDRGGGGGAGGQYAVSDIGVSFNQNFSVIVAGQTSGPTANYTDGSQGADSEFALGATVLVRAKGGAGGVRADGTRAGGVGSDAGGIGDEVYEGGSGGNGTATASGGGGGGAGSGGVGGSASGTEAGTGTSVGGGNGGGGQSVNSNGNPGINFGGGGAGARRSSSGGNGAQGVVRITYTCPQRANAGPDQSLCSGSTTSLLANTAIVGTGVWTVVSGSGNFADANSPNTTVTNIGLGANVYRWTLQNGECTNSDEVVIARPVKYWAGSGTVLTGGTTSTDFNAAANWSSTGPTGARTATTAPSPCDDVVFTTANGSAVLSASATVNSLSMSHSGNGNVFTLNSASHTLTVNGNTNLIVTSGNSFTDLRLNPGTGTMIFNGDFVSSSASSAPYVVPHFGSGAGTIVYRGNVTYNPGTFLYPENMPATIVFDGLGFQQLNTNLLAVLHMPTLQIGGYSSNQPSVTIGGSVTNGIRPNNIIVNSTLIIPSTGADNDYGLLRNSAGGSLTVNSGGRLVLGGRNLGGNTALGANNFPQNYTTITLNHNSTVEYNGTEFQQIFGTPTYGNLTINNSSATGVGLNAPVLVNNTLNMLSGDIATTSANLLSLGSSVANPGTLNWVSGTVAGPMRRWFNATANSGNASGLFPVGNNPGAGVVSRWALVEYSSAPATAGYLTAQFMAGAPSIGTNGMPLTDVDAQIVDLVATDGYWDIEPGALSGGNYNLTVRANQFASLDDMDGTKLIKSPDPHTVWTFDGAPAGPSGSVGDFVIGRTGMSGYSWFAIGYSSALLPVELIRFTARAVDNEYISLEWTTATEIENDGFEIQRSANGVDFEAIGWVNGNGNSTAKNDYSFNDYEAVLGVNYYRLKQIDFDGQFEYSKIVSAKMGADASISYLSVYPNPTKGDLFVEIEADNQSLSNIRIYNHMGQQVGNAKHHIVAGKNKLMVNTQNLISGTYLIIVESNEKIITTNFVVIK